MNVPRVRWTEAVSSHDQHGKSCARARDLLFLLSAPNQVSGMAGSTKRFPLPNSTLGRRWYLLAHLRSHSGPGSSAVLHRAPTGPEFGLALDLFWTRVLDYVQGRHRPACPRAQAPERRVPRSGCHGALQRNVAGRVPFSAVSSKKKGRLQQSPIVDCRERRVEPGPWTLKYEETLAPASRQTRAAALSKAKQRRPRWWPRGSSGRPHWQLPSVGGSGSQRRHKRRTWKSCGSKREWRVVGAQENGKTTTGPPWERKSALEASERRGHNALTKQSLARHLPANSAWAVPARGWTLDVHCADQGPQWRKATQQRPTRPKTWERHIRTASSCSIANSSAQSGGTTLSKKFAREPAQKQHQPRTLQIGVNQPSCCCECTPPLGTSPARFQSWVLR